MAPIRFDSRTPAAGAPRPASAPAASQPAGTNIPVQPPTTGGAAPTGFVGGPAQTGPNLGGAAAGPTPQEIGENVASRLRARGENVVDVIATPTRKTSASASFEFGSNGRKLAPGEELVLVIPPELQNRTVRSVILVHRQDAAHDTGASNGGYDQSPGNTSVNLLSTKDGTWRAWNSPWGESGKWGAKFAEQRSAYDPEFENEFDWNMRGHRDVEGHGAVSTQPLNTSAARIASVGTDPVFVHKVIVSFLGEKPSQIKEHIFSQGTVFGDWDTGAGRALGGGQKFQGTFPGALALGGYSAAGTALPAGWKASGNTLTVDLEPGKVVTGVDIACGDSHQDKVRNKDGGWGTPGWSRLSMGIQHADGNTEWFMEGQGVPPEGVMSGGPVVNNQLTRPGDKLVVKADSDTLFVMGLRVGLK